MLLAGLSEPRRVADELPIVMPDEIEALQAEWAANPAPRTDPWDTPIHRIIADQADRTPGRIAVGCDGAHLTYDALRERVGTIAHGLRAAGVSRGDRIGLFASRSLDAAPALLGILQAGAAFVPLDPGHPAERVNHTLRDAECVAVLADRARPAEIDDLPWLDLNDDHPVVDGPVHDVSAASLDDVDHGRGELDDLAYVMYTSGSTGRPKGVGVTHANLLHFLRGARDRLALSSDDVMTAMTTLTFDPALMELFVPLAVGARIEVAPARITGDASALTRSDRGGRRHGRASHPDRMADADRERLDRPRPPDDRVRR